MAIPKRVLGKTGLETSILGFGAMRLPVVDGVVDKIDEPLAIDMIRKAIDAGVNYVDTAWSYHSANFPQPGMSEPLVAKALADGYREKVNLATKLPVWVIQSREDMDRHLDLQLSRLGVSFLDVYLIHNLNNNTWPKMRDLDVFSFLDAAVKDGRVKHPGFSFHDNFDLFSQLVNAYDWHVTQIQYNYLDTAYQAGEKGLKLASDKGLGVVVMEPLRGGFLISNVPDHLKAMLKEIRPQWSLADWALRWIWDQPATGTVLSGMSTMAQTEENLKIAATASPADFGAPEREALAKVREWFISHVPVNCTGCGYCLPCPKGVAIPNIFSYFNDYHFSDEEANHTRSKMMYASTIKDDAKADKCVSCHVCESRCPQGIPIAERMGEAAAMLGL